MDELTDAELLKRFVESGCNDAFAALVRRHLNLVYSVALRQTSRPAEAEDIAQAVFLVLAKKARSLRGKASLAGWLYQTARLTAANARRTEARRIQRERESYMRSLDETAEGTNVWLELEPQLDAAMCALRAADREALALRFFQNKSLSETGMVLGLSERATQKRVSRALEKLRVFFGKRGITVPTATLAAVLSANSVQAAPAALATTISATVLQGSAVATPMIALVKGTLKIMAMTKAKITAGVAVALLLLGVATVAVAKRTREGKLVQRIHNANTGLPQAQTQAKTLIFMAMSQSKIPEAASWCDTLNASGKVWPNTPTNTTFAINARFAGRPYSRADMRAGSIPPRAVVFFESSKTGWNQSGGPELLPKEGSIAVAFADGTASVINAAEAANLQWAQ